MKIEKKNPPKERKNKMADATDAKQNGGRKGNKKETSLKGEESQKKKGKEHPPKRKSTEDLGRPIKKSRETIRSVVFIVAFSKKKGCAPFLSSIFRYETKTKSEQELGAALVLRIQ